MKISIPIEYVDGHLSYGHWEANITPEQYEALNSGDEFVQEEVLNSAKFVLDDYDVDYMGDALFNEIEIIE